MSLSKMADYLQDAISLTKQPCRCGRTWIAKWHGSFGYKPMCPGCGKTPKNCICQPVNEVAIIHNTDESHYSGINTGACGNAKDREV